MSDPYQILGVPKSATAAEIKTAYRKLAKKLHPDVNPGRKDIEQKFKEVTAAYDLLSDADKRTRFDRGDIDSQGQERGFGGGNYGGFRHSGSRSAPNEDPFSAFGGMEDIFAEFMGGNARRQRGYNTHSGGGPRGGDIANEISIPFVEACLGGKKRVTLTSGKTLEFTLPAGTPDGHKLRLKGQGQPGTMGGAAGDAIIELKVEPHPYFTRKDNDILMEAPISLPEAILGATITIPTLDGQVAIKIPKAAQSGTTLRLKGKGISTGDMLVKLKILLPDPLPHDLADLIEKWSKKNPYNPRKKLWNIE